MLNEIALTAPVPAASRPITLSVVICSMSAKATAPPLSVTHPSVTSNLASSNAALPRSACAILVASVLVVAAFRLSLLCAICAVPLTSLLTIAPGLICKLLS